MRVEPDGGFGCRLEGGINGRPYHPEFDSGFGGKPGGGQDVVEHTEFTSGDPGDKNGNIEHTVTDGGLSGKPGGGQDVKKDTELTGGDPGGRNGDVENTEAAAWSWTRLTCHGLKCVNFV